VEKELEMKILVCIKQVPDMESKFKINGTGTWYDTSDLAWRMNEYDEYAVEQAVQVKEALGSGDITVLCIGADQVKETMKKALAMGCDRGVHVSDESVYTKDAATNAAIIAEFAKDKGFDLIFTGMQSQDRGSGQTGVLIAEGLGYPCVTTIVDFKIEAENITVKRELEGGVKGVISLQSPAVLTCQLGLNTPRYPTLPNIMKAKKKELITIASEELQKVTPLQETLSMQFPAKKGGGTVLEGDPQEIVEQLIKILKDKTTILA
jgi:electron transfer flavoprotein beta subunit